MFKKILVMFFMGFMQWAYQATRPPPSRIYGSADGPPVTTTRIKLSDGRHLSYKEYGVPIDKAHYKIVYIHGFDSCKHYAVDVAEGLGVYIMSNDRPGYKESDPNPKQTMKSLALAGVALIAPVVNYWCPGFPANLSKEAYYQQLPQD
ncbi:hypothetical protein TEA_007805 [Camellia sinensis var. sinensis]|uniref:Serine aminopeptidase S33 domain-containing protein n=1 Tax=Camellia sinensis var. sinensis TaxID=542762 RepID=A0A4S4ERC2_CAMSN|nr:hypothetical protein TEA_007805 [Camellia sinensis var. sinensis]